MEKLYSDIKSVKGVGDAKALLFSKMGVYTVYDLINYFPRDYDDRRVITNIKDIKLGEKYMIRAMVATYPKYTKVRKGLEFVKLSVTDDTGRLNITFFNNRFIKDKLILGHEYYFYGKIGGKPNLLELVSPEVFDVGLDDVRAGRIVPIYPLSHGMTQNYVFKTVKEAFLKFGGEIHEIQPPDVVSKYNLLPLCEAYKNVHFPTDDESLLKARDRLIFDEFFNMSAGIMMLKNKRIKAKSLLVHDVDMNDFARGLPFKLTRCQVRSIREAIDDMKGNTPMNRLLQGDVGSGKTAVAEALLYFIVKNGYQGALMVPTEVLAEQHYSEISMLFEGFGIKTVLLTGSMKKSERSKALSDIETGKVQVIIGTHALISEDVKFYNLGLVIADEQHRFGVAQRAMLQSKGNNPHVLVMSATPIPRTLALMLYGDLDISVLDELPPNRQKVDTFFVNGGMEKRVHAFIEKNVDEGGQVYIVCPMIEESEENEDMYSAEAYAERISKLFPQYRIGLIHGKLKTAQKETIMREFAAGNIDVLVATTVIEVGMNVPNASLMVVWNAERFGLSQLHQLRGRVGRGQRKSYCILVSDTRSKMTHDRLTVMTKTNDGFKISEEDLKLRGPGDFFGIRQHGLPEMRIANMSADMIILKQAQEAALNMLREDPSLRLSKNAGIKKALEHMFKRATTNGSFN